MAASGFTSSAVTLSVLLAGCGGAGSKGAVPTAITPSVAHHATGTNGDLLYVGKPHSTAVRFLSFPGAKAEGSFKAPNLAAGLCSDSAGNLWVATEVASVWSVVEYAHGGTTPLATLPIPGADIAYGCTVDPTTNNLAVMIDGIGTVAIFQNEQGTPQTYKDGDMGIAYALTYDTHSNLFVYGFQLIGGSKKPILGELPSGGSRYGFSNLTLEHKVINCTFAQWRGNYMLVGAITKLTGRNEDGTETETVWKVAVSASGLNIKSSKTFEASRPEGIGPRAWLQGDTLIQQDAHGNHIYYFSYKSGGKPTKVIPNEDGSGGSYIGLALSR